MPDRRRVVQPELPFLGERLLNETSSCGKVYLVGAGPGDPGLITVRGAEVLASADVVLVDGLVNPELRKLASQAVEWISVGKHGGPRIWKQAEIDDALIEQARLGKAVVRLKGGDSGVFARTAEELQRLIAEKISFEIVPGITAALASAAYTGIPLTHRDWSSAVALVTAQLQAGDGGPETDEPLDWSALARFPGTLVMYMGVTSAPIWSRRLIEAGMSSATPVAIVRRCSWSDQQVIRCRLDELPNFLGSNSKLRPPVLTIVGEVARLGENFDWFSKRPLHGKSILVARPEKQADSTARRLRDLGAEVYVQPSIALLPPADYDKFDDCIRRLPEFDWLIFTSANGVEFFFRRLKELGLDGRAIGCCRIAGVGPSIADALTDHCLRIDFVLNGETSKLNAESLATELIAKFGATKTVMRCLVARADRGKTTLEERLASAGHGVESVIAYRSVEVEAVESGIRQIADAGKIDYVFASSTLVATNLIRLLGASLKAAQWVCISPEVESQLRQSGVRKTLLAAQSSVDSMLDCLIRDESN